MKHDGPHLLLLVLGSLLEEPFREAEILKVTMVPHSFGNINACSLVKRPLRIRTFATAHQVQIDMVETPLFHRQSVDVVNTWDEIGLSYENGFITGVKEDSPAAIAKLPLEETIIQASAARRMLYAALSSSRHRKFCTAFSVSVWTMRRCDA